MVCCSALVVCLLIVDVCGMFLFFVVFGYCWSLFVVVWCDLLRVVCCLSFVHCVLVSLVWCSLMVVDCVSVVACCS